MNKLIIELFDELPFGIVDPFVKTPLRHTLFYLLLCR